MRNTLSEILAHPGDRLPELVLSEQWQEHLAALTETLGFSLSVYTASGAPVYAPPGDHPLCRPLRNAGAFHAECDASCGAFVREVMRTGEGRVFKCAARITCFTLPFDYLGERAVILGRGAFASEDDRGDYRTLVLTYALHSPLPAADELRATSEQDARNASRVVDQSVKLLLQNARDASALKRQMSGLKEVMASWASAGDEDTASIMNHLAHNLRALFQLGRASVLLRDRLRGGFVDAGEGPGAASVVLSQSDPVVLELRGKKTYILSSAPERFRRPDQQAAPPAGEALYFFPLWCSGELEGIAVLENGRLSDSDAQTVTALCRQTALAVENHKLHNGLYAKFSRFTALGKLAGEIAPTRNYDKLLQSILEKSASLLMAEQGSLMLLDHDTDALLLEARKGAEVTEKLRVPKGQGIAGLVAAQGEPLLVENVESDPRVRQKNRGHYKTPSCVSVPLKLGDQLIGVLNLADKVTGEVFDQVDLQLLQSFATHAAVVLQCNALYKQTERLKTLAITDPLTGLLNRRYFQERMEEELVRSQRYERRMSLLMLDVDGFKTFNDTFGHLAGDKALKLIGESLLKSVRSIDIISRYGGDEFVVILPETDTELALNIAERIRNEVEAGRYLLENGGGGPAAAITVSIGIATFPHHGDSSGLLLERVDKALYLAKATGRNRISVYKQ